MLTSVIKKVFDKDVVCNYGFSLVSSNQFRFPVSGLISPSTIDGEAVIGSITPLASIKAQFIVAQYAITLQNPASSTASVLINADGVTAPILTATYSVDCQGAMNVNNVGDIEDFYNLYVITKASVDSYASNLNLINATMITNALSHLSTTHITTSQWGFVGTMNQNVSSGSAVSFISLGVGNVASTGTVSANTAITTQGTILATSNISSYSGNIFTTSGHISSGDYLSAVTTITAGTGISATTGNISAVAGAVSASTTVTAGTNVILTAGNILAAPANAEYGNGSLGIIRCNGIQLISNSDIDADGHTNTDIIDGAGWSRMGYVNLVNFQSTYTVINHLVKAESYIYLTLRVKGANSTSVGVFNYYIKNISPPDGFDIVLSGSISSINNISLQYIIIDPRHV